MFSLFLCEKNELVRFDIIETVQNCFADAHLHISDSLKSLAEELVLTTSQSVVLMSGTPDEIGEFFALQTISPGKAFVLIGEEFGDGIPTGFPIAMVSKPFSSEALLEGIKTALSALR